MEKRRKGKEEVLAQSAITIRFKKCPLKSKINCFCVLCDQKWVKFLIGPFPGNGTSLRNSNSPYF
jgi:hypothetical protein